MKKRVEAANSFHLPISFLYIHIFLSVAIQTDESLKSQSAMLGRIFLYHIYTESNNNNHKKKTDLIHMNCVMCRAAYNQYGGDYVWGMRLLRISRKSTILKMMIIWYRFLPVLVLTCWWWPEHGCVWFSGKLQSFPSLPKLILSDTRVITEILWMNFSNHECMAWPFFAHYMSFGCIQLHGLFKPNNLKQQKKREEKREKSKDISKLGILTGKIYVPAHLMWNSI